MFYHRFADAPLLSGRIFLSFSMAMLRPLSALPFKLHTHTHTHTHFYFFVNNLSMRFTAESFTSLDLMELLLQLFSMYYFFLHERP